MDFKTFQSYILMSNTLCNLDYLQGYQYGLRRNYHGENFGEDKMIAIIKSKNNEITAGLNDGLAGNKPKI